MKSVILELDDASSQAEGFVFQKEKKIVSKKKSAAAGRGRRRIR
jgi:hypothetical protein